MSLCVACDRVEVPSGVFFCPDCAVLWSCDEDCDCLVSGPASDAEADA